MNIKITNATSIKPLLNSNLLAYITRETFGINIRILEDHMEIIFAVSAVVAESITAVVAGITIEKAMGVFRPRKESQRVVWMSRVIYQLWELSTAQMEGKIARLACCGKDGWIVFSFSVKKKDDH
ncbi:hypothetical protein H5410_017452 [Solanum commersonii]|uniref:Uncharacterized protein n=1 Tax=Solanum commersonii TaxID=4109 RepID=A0A9J6A0E0_SOLCO|nr:hypothetical protein H5410_017452 [Solanum commersonii]